VVEEEYLIILVVLVVVLDLVGKIQFQLRQEVDIQ
jgi:hypothetical protein